jgi:hypothetical protein
LWARYDLPVEIQIRYRCFANSSQHRIDATKLWELPKQHLLYEIVVLLSIIGQKGPGQARPTSSLTQKEDPRKDALRHGLLAA